MGMNPAMLVAVAATIGNLLQGWDNATIAGIFSIFTPLLHFGFLHQLHNVPLLPKHSLSQCLTLIFNFRYFYERRLYKYIYIE